MTVAVPFGLGEIVFFFLVLLFFSFPNDEDVLVTWYSLVDLLKNILWTCWWIYTGSTNGTGMKQVRLIVV